ncbi:Uncharacterised protein [Mycobacteroides abscessus subsp. massiliense]|nr:Uncharacterised protein [Mycobacteroides abscessus subsp. massiliense]
MLPLIESTFAAMGVAFDTHFSGSRICWSLGAVASNLLAMAGAVLAFSLVFQAGRS